MTKKPYIAIYEIEVSVPLHSPEGELLDLDIAPNYIDKVGHCYNSGAGFGYRDADGNANFDTVEKALQWQKEVQQELNELYPEIDYPDTKPECFVGLRVEHRDIDDDAIYLDIKMTEDGHYAAVGTTHYGDPITIPIDEIEIAKEGA